MTLNAPIICVKDFNPGKGATIGKKYEVKNGKITYDNGTESLREFENIEHLNKYNIAKYELVPKRGRRKVKS